MSKVLTVIAVVVGAAIAGDRMLGALADSRHGVRPDVASDMKQMVNLRKEDGAYATNEFKPKTELGSEVKDILVRIQKRDALLESELKKCSFDKAMEWQTIATPEGRSAALKWMDDEISAYRSYYADTCEFRKQLGALLRKHGQPSNGTLDAANAEDGKLCRARVELYAKYKEYIQAVGKSKLAKEQGKSYFVNDLEADKCDALLQRYNENVDKFEEMRLSLLASRQKQREMLEARMR
jgi:hypothetical protein